MAVSKNENRLYTNIICVNMGIHVHIFFTVVLKCCRTVVRAHIIIIIFIGKLQHDKQNIRKIICCREFHEH
jgi:hypothetical protein